MKNNQKFQDHYMNMNATLSVIGGKYCSSILYVLANKGESVRFNELKHAIGDIPCKTLSSTLKKMEDEQILLRTEYPQIPPRVEYSLTEKGYSLIPVLKAMDDWGSIHSV